MWADASSLKHPLVFVQQSLEGSRIARDERLRRRFPRTRHRLIVWPIMRRLLIASLFAGLLIFADLPTRSPFPGKCGSGCRSATKSGRATGVRLRVTDARGILGRRWASLAGGPIAAACRAT